MASNKMKKAVLLHVSKDITNVGIAKEVGVTERTVYNWKNSDEWKQLSREFSREYFSDLAISATKTMQRLLDAKSEFVQFQAAQDILNRAGIIAAKDEQDYRLGEAKIRKIEAEADKAEQETQDTQESQEEQVAAALDRVNTWLKEDEDDGNEN